MSVTIKSLLHPVRQNEGRLHMIFMLFSSPGPLDRAQTDMKWTEAWLMTAGMRLLSTDRYSDGLLFTLQSSMHEKETRNSLLRGIIYRAKHCIVPVLTTIDSFTL